MTFLRNVAPRIDIAGQLSKELGYDKAGPLGDLSPEEKAQLTDYGTPAGGIDIDVDESKFWSDLDGPKVPREVAAREDYDKRFEAAIRKAVGEDRKLTPEVFHVRHIKMGNRVAHKDRYRMYRRMLKAGDRLPPIIVTADGRIYDGNHRYAATVEEGFPTIEGFRLD